MAKVVPMKRPLIPSEAERRGKLASDTPGEAHFSDVNDYITYMAANVRLSGKNMASLARASDDTIKSGQTISRLAYGWSDKKGKHHQTHRPGFRTMFGIANALGLEVVIRSGRKK